MNKIGWIVIVAVSVVVLVWINISIEHIKMMDECVQQGHKRYECIDMVKE